MPTLEELRTWLKARRINTVADQAQINRQTLYNFSSGATKSLSLENYQKLANVYKSTANPQREAK